MLLCRFHIVEQKRKVLESNVQVRRGMFYIALCRVSVECCSSRGVLAQVSSGVMSHSDSSSCLATPKSQLKFSPPCKTLTHKSTEVSPGHLNSLELKFKLR